MGLCLSVIQGGFGDGQEAAAQCEFLGAMAIGEKAVVADALESVG